ncbi:MAG: aspartate aminotransferase family protein [Spirochaetia bacterium]|nr:aspartate aminotransferase family protein [Spirochaetia bacterium]
MSEIFQKPLTLDEIKEKTDRYLFGNYARLPRAFYFGQGELLYDTDNRSYIDFFSGIAVTSLGHGEADIIEAIREQSDRIIHSSNLFYNQEQALLAEVLIQHTFPGKVFLCNSGTEANEAAFKLSRLFGQKAKGGAEKIISLHNSFHGRTSAGMALTGQEKIHSGFGNLIPGMIYLPPNDIAALENEIEASGKEICAFFLEPVQGEGGIHPLDTEYVLAAKKICEENEILFVFDEIQTGLGRTGKLFAYEHYNIKPDILTLAKALGNGFPVGAMIAKEDLAEFFSPGVHGSTFGGNHLASRVAYETIKIIMSRELLDHVVSLGDFMMQRLLLIKQKFDSVTEIRGMGLHLGIEMQIPCRDLVLSCLDRGLVVNCTSEKTIRIMPPLNLSLENASKGLDILENCISEFK